MTAVYREFKNGWLLAMNDEVGMRAVPASLFRFGVEFAGEPSIEYWQRNGAKGYQCFVPGHNEDDVRALLAEFGFVEAPRYTEGAPSLEQIAADMGL